MITGLENSSWRFYFLHNDDGYYCFDCFTHKIYSIKKELYTLLQNKKYNLVKKEYKKFYKQILQKQSFVPKEFKDDKCYVTINFSNTCNLKCKYCYRDKEEKRSLSENSLKEIVEYVKKTFFPSASQYIFSLCYTSESSYDLDKLKYFDYLIGQYEGYLYSEKEITKRKILKILEQLPKKITEAYKENKDPLNIINTILLKEKLWEIYDYSKHDFLSSLLAKTKKLSASKTVMVNRQILNYIFPKLSSEKPIQYMSMSFMTNATNITDDYISFLKSRLETKIYVSLDGPENIHDMNRIYHDGTGSYNDVIAGIEKLKKNGIDIIPSAVITPIYTDLNSIVEHFINLGFKTMTFNLVRGKTEETCFSLCSINNLINNIKKIYEEIFIDFKRGIISDKLIILRNTFLFIYLRNIYYRNYVTARCKWGKSVVIDSKGNLYHCDSTIGFKDDYLGNYHNKKTKKELLKQPNINDYSKCKNCYAKYLCGGTCYAELIFNNKQNELMECHFRKELINESIKFYIRLKNEKLLDNFMKILSADIIKKEVFTGSC